MPFIEYEGPGEMSGSALVREPYELAARFATDRLALRAYSRAQEAVFRAPCDLSVFRLLLEQAPHVAVIGARPPDELERDLRRMLSFGQVVSLPSDITSLLWARRLQANREGAWVERHFRPGRPL